MSVVAFDTLKVAQQFQDAGFTRKQAAGAAEILVGLLAEKSDKDAVVKAIETLGISVDRRFGAVDKRFDGVDQQLVDVRADIAELQAGQTEMRGDITEMRGDITEIRGDITEMRGNISTLQAGQNRLMSLIEKVLEGQAVLSQNDMELRRLIESRLAP
ncbi:MAG: hypothetical protein WCJ64_27000 [Rhodospirillaceae bacterium]